MLFRSVENQIVSQTLPRTVAALTDWDPQSDTPPDEPVFRALAHDLMIAVEQKTHTQLGTRLNYENSGMSSLFRSTGRDVEDFGEDTTDALHDLDELWKEPMTWVTLLAHPNWITAQEEWVQLDSDTPEPAFALSPEAQTNLPRTAAVYADFARTIQTENEDSPTEEDPWHIVSVTLVEEITANPSAAAFFGPYHEPLLNAVAQAAIPPADFAAAFAASDETWATPVPWQVIRTFGPPYTAGYFLNAIDLQQTPDGIAPRPDDERVYIMLFLRTMVLSLTITGTCILLGYPIAWLLANLPPAARIS